LISWAIEKVDGILNSTTWNTIKLNIILVLFDKSDLLGVNQHIFYSMGIFQNDVAGEINIREGGRPRKVDKTRCFLFYVTRQSMGLY
jgi:hypothetical protein